MKSKLGPFFRVVLIAAAILAAVGIALSPRDHTVGPSIQMALTFLALCALPVVAFVTAPGKLWVKALVFSIAFIAFVAATIALLSPDDARYVIELALWLLAMVGGGLVYWLWLSQRDDE